MKLAVAGKGGSGKTSISGTMARLVARSGHSVLAIDGDTNPNLALTIGIPAERFNEVPVLPRDLLRRTDGEIELTRSLAEVRESHSISGPDGVTLLVMAHPHEEDAGTGCFCGMHATVRTLIEAVSEADEDFCVLDTEASPEHLTRGTSKYADVMLIVVEPWFKSLETGRRMAELGRGLGVRRIGLLANKIRDQRELEAVREFAGAHELELQGVIPFDERLLEAEREGVAPFDHAPDAAAVEAIGEITRGLLEDGMPTSTCPDPARTER
jgi:CO dehydrogenase maturation factor